jgi:hypothetical protein
LRYRWQNRDKAKQKTDESTEVFAEAHAYNLSGENLVGDAELRSHSADKQRGQSSGVWSLVFGLWSLVFGFDVGLRTGSVWLLAVRKVGLPRLKMN